jgi:ferredoxin-NADP reductase
MSDFTALPFLLFACIADRGPGIGVREAMAFTQAIQQPDWSRSPSLVALLASCDARYSSLWKDYAAGRLPADAASVRRQVQEWLQTMDEAERRQARSDLNVLTLNLFNARAPWWRRRSTTRSRESFTLEGLLSRLGQATNIPSGAVAVPVMSTLPTKSLMDAVLDPQGFWQRGGVEVRCVAVIDETHDVKTFRFAPVNSVLFCYKAGQAATIEVPTESGIVRRSYTISSSPSRPSVIEFTVKLVERGVCSNWLHNHLRPGMVLTIHGPHGRFNYYDLPSMAPVMISAGSGITPMLAMTRWLTDTSTPAQIDFLHYAKSDSDLIARDELEHMCTRFPNLKLTWVCTDLDIGDNWSGERERLSLESLERLVPDFLDRDFYLCGPPGFMEFARKVLGTAGCDERRVHNESFGVRVHQAGAESVAPQSPSTADESIPSQYTLRLVSSDKSSTCAADQFVLDALEASGVTVPYSCRAGVCGTCKVLKQKGTVAIVESEGLSPEDQEQGYILSCCTRPTSNLELVL